MSHVGDTPQVDARGMQCPLPVLKAKKALTGLAPGGTLEVLTTDPASVRDFDDFSQRHGHLLLNSTKAHGEYRFVIRKSAAASGDRASRRPLSLATARR